MKSHHNHKETFCLYHCLVLTALMPLGVKKASHHSQTCERLQEATVRLPIRQQGGKCLPCFWLQLVGGKVKTKQAGRRKISFFNVLEQWEKLCYPDCPVDNPMYICLLHISRTQRQTCAHTCNTKIPLASIGGTPSWADLHSRKSQLAPPVKFQLLHSWPSTIDPSARIQVELWDIYY